MRAPRGRLLLAYATVYLVWGSSYLFIKFAVESLPPLPMAGVRFLLAGLILCGAARFLHGSRGTREQWRVATIVGVALMASNAAVAYAVTRIPSGVAALLVAITPCWMVLLDWLQDRRKRPHTGVVVGLAMGMVGIVVLIGPSELFGAGHTDLAGAGAIVAGTLMWSVGSLYARQAPRPPSAQLLSGMQMVAGGATLLLFSVLSGGLEGFSWTAVTLRSWVGFVYLVLVASLAGFTAYIYLLTHASPARASTYAFVNPVVAVSLGALFGREALTARVGGAAAIIVAAVAVIVTAGSSTSAKPPHTALAPTEPAPEAPLQPRDVRGNNEGSAAAQTGT